MVSINCIPHCYGYLVVMVTKRYLNNSFVSSPIEFIFDMKVPKDDKHQLHPLLLWQLSCHNNQCETWQQATPCLLEGAVYQI